MSFRFEVPYNFRNTCIEYPFIIYTDLFHSCIFTDDGDVTVTPELNPVRMEMVSSKDGVQLAKLSVNLHVWVSAMLKAIDKRKVTIENEVPVWAINAAHKLYTLMVKQRSIYIQAG